MVPPDIDSASKDVIYHCHTLCVSNRRRVSSTLTNVSDSLRVGIFFFFEFVLISSEMLFVVMCLSFSDSLL